MASKDWRSLGLVGRMFRELRDENRAGAAPEAADLEAGLEQVSGGEMEASCKALFPMMNLRK